MYLGISINFIKDILSLKRTEEGGSGASTGKQRHIQDIIFTGNATGDKAAVGAWALAENCKKPDKGMHRGR